MRKGNLASPRARLSLPTTKTDQPPLGGHPLTGEMDLSRPPMTPWAFHRTRRRRMTTKGMKTIATET